MRSAVRIFVVICMNATVWLGWAPAADAWKNGPPDNKVTNSLDDCLEPPYATHDWVIDQAVSLLPETERQWLTDQRRFYLIGTEAPDYAKIMLACGVPHRGYNDTGRGRHDLRWASGFETPSRDTPARRAEEEYAKAVEAWKAGRADHAAFYLGAAAHYVGDLSQYGHNISGESHHKDFELWIATKTDGPRAAAFMAYIAADGLQRRTAYDAVVATGRAVAEAGDGIIRPDDMDWLYGTDKKHSAAFHRSIGLSLNRSVNNLADVLHTFYIDVVKQ